MKRKASITRKTKETKIDVELNIDGKGQYKIDTGIGFLDHMLEQLSKHSSIDLKVKAKGDTPIDLHHTTEDTGIAIGECLKKASKKIKTEFIPVSADANDNIAELRDKIYDELQFIRIYMRPKGGKTDYKEPLIIRNGNSVLDVCNKLHRNLKKDFRYGLVWGKSVKFAGQRVGRNHVLCDEDVLTIIKIKGT